MSLNFKSWVMDGYQLADESYHGLKDKLYDKVKLSKAELEEYEHELWEDIKEQKFREYVYKYNTELIVGEQAEQNMEAMCYAWEGSTWEERQDAIYHGLDQDPSYVNPHEKEDNLEERLCDHADKEIAFNELVEEKGGRIWVLKSLNISLKMTSPGNNISE